LWLGLSAPAWAVDIRPSGYLERGTLEKTDEGVVFVPDAVSGRTGGRYFRLGGYDNLVTYGLGEHPAIDWFWPSYKLRPGVKDILAVSPGATGRMITYEESQDVPQSMARVGWLVLTGAVVTALGGLVYNKLPGNLREMQPNFWYATAGTATVGALMYGGGTWLAKGNEMMLDEAIAAYNRDMAGKRKLRPPVP
jgi:hypothetical protein